MAEVTAQTVKDLREKTGAGMMDCKKALAETNGDMEAAIDWLRKKGLSAAAKKSGRVAAEGLVGVATSGGAGAALEINAETDFVARTDEFKGLARDIAMQVVAQSPRFISPELAPPEVVDAEGLTEADLKSASLTTQDYFRDPKLSVGEKIKEVIAKSGENIRIRRFERYELGR